MTELRLDPKNAALSIKARLETMRQCEEYIAETVKRYDGLRAFESKLEAMGISSAVHAIASARTEGE